MTAQRRILPPRRDRMQPDISLAIVNIVLLLILFFLATGAMMNAPAPTGVRLSETRDLPIELLPSPVLVIENGAALTLDGTSILAEDLARLLAGESVLHIVIDRDAPAEDLLSLLERPGLQDLDIRLATVHRRGAP